MIRKPLFLLTVSLIVFSLQNDRPTLNDMQANRTGHMLHPAQVVSARRNFINSEDSEKIAAAFRKAIEGFQKNDYKTAAENLKSAYLINPADDLIINFITESYAMAGDRRNALQWLRKLLTVSPCFFHLPEDAAPILNSPEYKKLARTARRIRPHESRLAFMLPESDLIPEGIAYDPADKAFFLSSLHKRKIVRVRMRVNGQPIVEDFTSEGQDGLYSTLGMKVDAGRGVLWVCSSAELFMKGSVETDAGRAALFKYDVKTRKLIRKYEIGPTPNHLLNDIALNAKGDAFVTDVASGEIFTLRHDKDELEVFMPKGAFQSPNGIAISADGQKLFISDVPLGVYVVDVKSKHSQRLAQNVGISPSGSDGLYFYRNSLIGIVNIVSDRAGRVARFWLDASGQAIVRGAVLDCAHPLYQWPTTGVVVGDSIFYIANSQFGMFDKEKRSFPKKDLHQVAVLRLKL